jgi:tetratricopeptide (TPR) repeat protein
VKYGDYYSSVNDISNAIKAYDDSLDYFKEAENFEYNHYTNIYYDRGRAYASLGAIYQDNNTEIAKEYFLKAINSYKFCVEHHYPNKTNAYFAIGNIFYEMGCYKESIDFYTDALKDDASDNKNRARPIKNDIFFRRSDAYYMLGVSSFNNKDYLIAVQYFIDSINDRSENYQAHYELGRTYLFQDMFLESIRQFDLIIERCPDKKYVGYARDGRNLANSKFK